MHHSKSALRAKPGMTPVFGDARSAELPAFWGGVTTPQRPRQASLTTIGHYCPRDFSGQDCRRFGLPFPPIRNKMNRRPWAFVPPRRAWLDIVDLGQPVGKGLRCTSDPHDEFDRARALARRSCRDAGRWESDLTFVGHASLEDCLNSGLVWSSA